MTLVSNIVSSPTIAPAAPTPSASRSHIEEVIDDVAKGGSTTPVSTVATPSVTTTATTSNATIVPEPNTSTPETNVIPPAPASSKAASIHPILRDVMKTPCLTSTTTPSTVTAPTTTTTSVASETLNLFDSHRRSTSPLKTTANTTTTTTNVSTTVTSSTFRRSGCCSTDRLENYDQSQTIIGRRKRTNQHRFLQQCFTAFPQLIPSEGGLFAAAAAHHPNFPYQLFNPSNPSVNSPSNLLSPSLLSNSPPLSVRTSASAANSSNSSATSHMMTNPLVNTIMSAQQQSGISGNVMHGHEKSRRETSSKGSTSSSLSNRSTPIQQTVPVPIPLNIPSSSNATPTNHSSSQQQQQSSLLSGLDPAAAAALRQQTSPLQPFLGAGLFSLGFVDQQRKHGDRSRLDTGVPFRSVYGEAADLYGTAPPGLYPPPGIAFAAQQMLNVMRSGRKSPPVIGSGPR